MSETCKKPLVIFIYDAWSHIHQIRLVISIPLAVL